MREGDVSLRCNEGHKPAVLSMVKERPWIISAVNHMAISQMMVFVNEAYKVDSLFLDYMTGFVQLLAPFAPHLSEELWVRLGQEASISYVAWPTYDPAQLVEDTVEIIFQVNGKVRGKATVARDIDQDGMIAAAKADDNVQKFIADKTIRKVIAIPGKFVNIVVG